MANFGPVWWHHHGVKMGLNQKETNLDESVLVINNVAARLEIYRRRGKYCVKWKIKHGPGTGEDSGERYFDPESLSAAFGLSNMVIDRRDRWLLDYGADYAKQFFFIRKGDYLNIPGPGTSHDGNPNISIALTEEIKRVVAKLTEMDSLPSHLEL